MTKNKKPVAFGCSAKRFERRGLHPNLGFPNQDCNKVGPGEYQHLEDWTKRRIPGKKWTEADRKGIECNLKFQQIKITKPACEDCLLPEKDLQEAKIRSTDFGLSKSERFTEPKSDTPGPGFYGKNHVPPLRIEEWSERRKYQGILRKTMINKFPEYLIAPDWKMTPAQYNVKHATSIQATVDKKTSKKGPFQIFSGKRDGTSLYGYFVEPKIEGDSTFYDVPQEMNRMQEPSKRHIGLWRSLQKKISRDMYGFHSEESTRFDKKPTQRHLLGNIIFAYRDPSEPGPADYFKEPTVVTKYRVNNPPFLSSAKSNRGVTEYTQCNPGATRYSPKSLEYVNGHRNVFQSRVPRLPTKKKNCLSSTLH